MRNSENKVPPARLIVDNTHSLNTPSTLQVESSSRMGIFLSELYKVRNDPKLKHSDQLLSFVNMPVTAVPSVRELLIEQSAKINELANEISALHAKIDRLTDDLTDQFADPALDEALTLARQYFEKNKQPTYPDELADKLGISVGLAIEVCEALVKEGEVVS